MTKEKLKNLIENQANDEGLWFNAETASEGYLQQELRKLHSAVETFLDSDIVENSIITVQDCLKCDKQIQIYFNNDDIMCDLECPNCNICEGDIDWFDGHVICELSDFQVDIKKGIVEGCPKLEADAVLDEFNE